MSYKPQEVVLRSIGIIVGRDFAAFTDLDKALKSADDQDFRVARESFDKLPAGTREKIRLHAESYAKLLRDD
jgi:hypothetical protein